MLIKKICAKQLVLIALLSAFCLSEALIAQEMTGYGIMKKSDELDTGKSSRYSVTMTLISKTGRKRERSILVFSKDYGDMEKTVMSFQAPKDVSGVGYLTWEYDEKGKDDDMWLYMPALKKVRRIAGSAKNDDFMGTDFTYEDMGSRDLDKDTHTIKGEEDINGSPCWIIESVPKQKGEAYSRRTIWVRKDNFVIAKIDFYDRQEKLLKQLSVSDIRQINGIWTSGRMEMKNVQDSHTTVIELKNVEYNVPINDSFFSAAALERGNIK